MKKYLLALFIIPVLLSFSQTVSAQGAAVRNLTPAADTIWSAGSNNNIGWNHDVGFGTGGVCSWSGGLGLIALRSDETPAQSFNMYGQATYAYPGQYQGQVNSTQPLVTAESGTISLPADALPGRYKVVARCQSVTMGNYEGYSIGIVTVSNPTNRSYYPLILTSPTAQLNFTAGVDASGVGIGLRIVDGATWVPAGTPVTMKMIKKSDGSTYWERIENLAMAGPEAQYLITGGGINPEDVSTIPAGTYFFRASMQHNGQNYSIDSADLIFTAPAPTVTSPRAGDNWAKGSTQTVSWDGDYSYWPQEIVAVSVRLEPSGVLLISRAPPPANKQFEVSIPATMSTGSVLIKVLFHSLSRTFEISSQTFNITADTAPAASITITTPKADGTTVWQANVANTITWQIDGGSFAADRLVAINRYAVSDPSTSLGSAFPLVNNLSYPVPANVLDPDNDPYFYTLTIGGVDARSGNFTVVDADDGNGNPPPHRSWAPPLYPPPQCAKPDGSDPDPGCYPPLNVSIEPQTKTGPLTVGSLIVDGGAFIRGVLKLPSLVAGSGQFLTTNSVGQVILGTPGGGPDVIDQTVWQRRVTGTCAGRVVVDVNEDGALVCEDDDTGSGTGPSLPTCSNGQVLKWNNGWGCGTDEIGASGTGDITSVKSSGAKSGLTVKNSAIVDGDAVGGEVLSGDAIVSLRRDCAAGQILKWNNGWSCATDNTGGSTGTTYTADDTTLHLSTANQFSIKNLGVGTAQINNAAVTTAKIADDAITAAKIGPDAVTNEKLSNAAVRTAEIADNAVTTSKIKDGEVKNADLGLIVARTAACTSPTGLNQYTNCVIPGSNTFCGLAQVKGDGGDCNLEASGVTWTLRAGAGGTGQTTCRAWCIPI